MHQACRCLQHSDAGAFGTDQRPRNMKAVFRQQLIQVVARDTAGKIGEACADYIGILVPQRLEPGVNLAASTALTDDTCDFFVAGATYTHAQTIKCEDFQFLYVFARHACHDRVGAARVIADHTSQRTLGMRCRIGSKCQMIALCRSAQVIKNDTRLHARYLVSRVDCEDVVHIFREIEHDRNITALARQTRPATTRENGRAKAITGSDGRNHVLDVSGNDDSNGNLPIIGAVCCIEGAATIIEAYLSANDAA